MDMAEIPKLEMSSSSSSSCCGSGESAVESKQKNMGTQRISVSDHINAFQYTAEKADSFVIDMDAFSSAINKDNNTNPNSRITRSLSRKGSQRGGDRKFNGNVTLDNVPSACSPKGVVGSGTPEKAGGVVGMGSTVDHSMSPHIHHQISISATTSGTTTAATTADSKSMTRRNSFRRSSSWALDPKRVLLFFATLSSMGTMLLIYFTLTISKQNADEYGG